MPIKIRFTIAEEPAFPRADALVLCFSGNFRANGRACGLEPILAAFQGRPRTPSCLFSEGEDVGEVPGLASAATSL